MMTTETEKSPREIAAAFAEKWDVYANPVDALELLIKCRDERAAKIADRFAAQNHEGAVRAARRRDMDMNDVLDSCRREAEAIASAIRGTQ